MNSKGRKQRDAAIIKHLLAPPRNDHDNIHVYDVYDDDGIYVDSKAVIGMSTHPGDKGKGKKGNVGSQSKQDVKSSSSPNRNNSRRVKVYNSQPERNGDSFDTKPSTKLRDEAKPETLLPHHIFENEVKFTTSNIWPNSFSSKEIDTYCKDNIPGVMVCELPVEHPLHGTGEKGLFASREFE